MITFRQFLENKQEIISSDDLVELVSSLHHRSEDLDEGDLIERITKYNFYKLQEVPSNKIDAEVYHSDPDMVKEYEEKIAENPNYPPIVLDEDFDIIDGTHRAKALKNFGHAFIKAYVPV